MKTRLFFREHGAVIRTQREIDWKWGAVAALLLVFFYAWSMGSDERAHAAIEADADAHSRGFSAGQLAGRADAVVELTPRLREAYQAGLNDALYAVRGRPEGLALAQACVAWGAARAGTP